MSTTSVHPETPVNTANQGPFDPLTALDGVEIGESVELGLDLLSAFAHLRHYVERMTKGTPIGAKGKTSTNNTYNDNVQPRFFKPSPLFLTERILHMGKISAGGRRTLEALSEAQTMSDWNETTVTKDIMAPACSLFVDIFSLGRKINGQLEWLARVDDRRDGGGDFDIKLNMADGEGGAPVAKATTEMKTPRAIGDGVARELTDPNADWNKGLLKLFHQLVEHAKDIWNQTIPKGGSINSALAWAPAHFIPLVYDGASLWIGQDLSASKKIWPDVVRCRASWTHFFNVLAAWIFMVIVTVDEDLKKEWEKRCPEQVAQATAFVSQAGKSAADPDINPAKSVPNAED